MAGGPSWNKTSNGYEVKKNRVSMVPNRSLLLLFFNVEQRLMLAATKNTKYVNHHT